MSSIPDDRNAAAGLRPGSGKPYSFERVLAVRHWTDSYLSLIHI